MRKLFLMLVMVLFIAGSTGLFSKVQVGEKVYEPFETSHPYQGKNVLEQEFHYPNAGYIALHFSRFDLAPGDFVVISSPDGKYSYTYKEKGKEIANGEVWSEFWATHIPGDTAVVKLISRNPRGGWGFVIDQWARGYEAGYIEAVLADLEFEYDSQIEAICSADNKKWAKCYEGTEMYNKSRAVCRLLIGGTSACTGWLLGSEGHVITNNHCIDTQTDAGNTDYEFMAEGALCTTNCASWGACPGVVEATSGTLIKTNAPMDYTLIKLPTNITSTYGYMQFRDTLAVIGERIYIPQHPGAYGKQLAVESDVDGGYAKVYSTTEPACQTGGPNDVGYFADTAGGSSGSPVLAYTDNLVVALHHCATCPNRGVPIPPIITDMGTNLPANAVGGSTPPPPPAAPTGLTAAAASCTQVNLAWTDNADNESGFKIERSADGTNFTQIGTVGANVTSYSDTTAAQSTSYWYRVKAYNGGGDSAYSNVAAVTTPACPPTPPAAPSNLAGTATQTSVTLTWADNSNDETGFRIYRGLSSTSLTLIATVGANTTTYTDAGLARKTRYYYKVCAYNAAGESCSSTISVRTK